MGNGCPAAQDVYDSASKAARKTAGSFERALKNTIETQPGSMQLDQIARAASRLLSPDDPFDAPITSQMMVTSTYNAIESHE